MKRNLIHFLLLFLFSLSACIPSGKLSEVVAYESGRPYTRWWWFASEPDTLDVKYQLEWLKEQGFGGVEIAWIYPMHGDSTVKRVDWLSTEWSEAVAYAKRIADALGLGCDFTYGTLWPFNEVGLPDEDGSRGFYDSISPVNRTLTWEHPKKARILNHLDKEAFYRYASKINSGLKDAYQGSKSGVFVDSWEVETRHMWTKGFGDKFKKRFGYAIEPFMDKLYQIGYEDVYYDYMSLISDYVLYEFYQPFTENANSQGAFSRSQCGGAPADLLSAFMLVDVPETEAILYEPNFGRIPASAAALAGKPIVSSETFTCLYGWNPWGGKGPYQGQEQVADMRLIADALFANGVNVFPTQIESVILEMEEFEPHYLLIVGRENNTDTMELQVEVRPDFYSDEINRMLALKKKLASRLQSVLGLGVNVKLVEPRSIERSVGKAKRVIDNRKI